MERSPKEHHGRHRPRVVYGHISEDFGIQKAPTSAWPPTSTTHRNSSLNCPYGFSKTPTEFLSTERKTNSFGSVKLRFVFPQARRVLPFTRGFPTANPIWAGGSPTDQTIPPVDQGVLGGSNRGKSHFLSSRGTPGLALGTLSHQIIPEGCPGVGNTFPSHHPLSDTHPGVPPIIFRPYVLFSLYNHYFIGPFEKCDHKNLQEKIYKKYQAMQNATLGRSR
jgi:hypothetical protein